MIVDNKGKLFGKISIVDALIVLVVIAAVAGVGYKYTRSKVATPLAKQDTLQVVLYSEEQPDFVVKAVKPGDVVIDSATGVTFGQVTDVKIGKAASVGINDSGEMVATSKPGYSSAYVTVEGKGIYTGSGAQYGAEKYYIGRLFYELRVGNVSLGTKIYDIKKKG